MKLVFYLVWMGAEGVRLALISARHQRGKFRRWFSTWRAFSGVPIHRFPPSCRHAAVSRLICDAYRVTALVMQDGWAYPLTGPESSATALGSLVLLPRTISGEWS